MNTVVHLHEPKAETSQSDNGHESSSVREQGIREGWIIPAKNPGVGLPPSDVTFTSDLTIEEVLREIRGT